MYAISIPFSIARVPIVVLIESQTRPGDLDFAIDIKITERESFLPLSRKNFSLEGMFPEKIMFDNTKVRYPSLYLSFPEPTPTPTPSPSPSPTPTPTPSPTTTPSPSPTPTPTPSPTATPSPTPTPTPPPAETTNVKIDDIPPWIIEDSEIQINNQTAKIISINQEAKHIQFLGNFEKIARKGLNTITKGKQQALFWYQEKQLISFSIPYENSYALVVAIGDYERKKDPKHRGLTGYDELDNMVEHAQKLVKTLQKVGFPEENIIALFDEVATSKAIEEILESFYDGGDREHANRLFFYFGGHGDMLRSVPYLVTYDYDKDKPTSNSLLMRDLTGKYAETIKAHHMLIALEACHAGLAVHKSLDDDTTDEEQLKRFRSLATIRRDTEPRARNILLAGTGEQKALWISGGIFTKALISALDGGADYNKDTIIQFEELDMYIRNRVTAEAAANNVRQDPDSYILNRLGNGRVIFLYSN